MRTDVDEATQKVLNTLWWDKIDQAAQVTCESKKGKQCRGQLTMESNTIDNTIAKRVVFPRGANNGDNVYCKQEHSFLNSYNSTLYSSTLYSEQYIWMGGE